MKNLFKTITPYFHLMRFDKPIGILLLLWPTLWALWIASKGWPSFKLIIIFVLGTVLMRAAGCIMNDYADRHIDGQVERTRLRPLAAGIIKPKPALILFFMLCLMAFILVCFLNALTISLAIIGLVLTLIYPFTKRYFIAPQLFLGLTFSWGIPMAFAAVLNTIPNIAWQLYGATLIWILIYDTEYALVDRDDDLKIPIYSTAVLFGKADRLIISLLQIMFISWMAWIGYILNLGLFFNLSLLVTACLFLYQQTLLSTRSREAYFRSFLNNNWVGLMIFLGVMLYSSGT